MLTLFSTGKPFRGHSGIIQRNALKSWTLLHPDVEIILFGDDEGAAEVSEQYGLRHEPDVERNEHGMKRLDYIFGRAQEIARHDILCYVNCDIILMADFCSALRKVKAAHVQFLMVGRRWDTDITKPINFSGEDWQSDVIRKALVANHQQTEWYIDYFAFSRGLYLKRIPPLVIGRVSWDNWLIWCARALGVPVVDASAVVLAVHQNHDYGYHPQGKLGVWNDEQAQRNLQLGGGPDHVRNILDATEVMRLEGLRPNRKLYWITAKRRTAWAGRFLRFEVWNPVWFFFLGITRPIRSALGLRSAAMRRSRGKL
jgi:hypothetical protein